MPPGFFHASLGAAAPVGADAGVEAARWLDEPQALAQAIARRTAADLGMAAIL
jgi:hypothetical protein